MNPAWRLDRGTHNRFGAFPRGGLEGDDPVTGDERESREENGEHPSMMRLAAPARKWPLRASSRRAWPRRPRLGPEGVELGLVERLGADVDPAAVLDADQEGLLDLE